MYNTTPIDGGLDLVTAPIQVKPGRLIDCQNYEIARQRGIRRMDGYEGFDGGQSPSFTGLTLLRLRGTQGGSHVSKFNAGNTGFIYSPKAALGVALDDGTPKYNIVCVVNNSTFNAGNTTIDVYVYLQTALPPGTVTCQLQMPSFSFSITTMNFGVPIFSTVAQQLAAAATIYPLVSANIQAVPGQGNVNGIFYLKDKVYATRDYFAFTFSTGGTQPNPGDTIYQGASFAGASWTGVIAKINQTSGTWTHSLASGNAAGSCMVYNTTGVFSNGLVVNNHTQGDIATVMTPVASGASVTSLAAGMYVATGGRGAATSTASWQWCDLGWNVLFKDGVVPFTNMNVTSQSASLSAQYVTTGWKTASTGNQASWTIVGGGSFPTDVGDNTDATSVSWIFFNGGNSNPTTGQLQMTNFGFTDADIPPTANITGMQIQVRRGSASTGTFTAGTYVADKTLQLVGTAAYPTHNGPNLALTTNNWGTVPPPVTNPVYTTQDYGAPTTAVAPTSLLGYNGITAADIKSTAFGLLFNCQLVGQQAAQDLRAFVTQVQVRFSYLPQGNQIYFWNPPDTAALPTDGAMTATVATLTCATSQPFTAAMVGNTVIVPGAGVAGATLVTTISGFTSASQVTLATAASTTVSGKTITYGVPVRAQVVQNYKQSGDTVTSNAAGTLYIQFIAADGTVGGTPIRAIGASEKIRTFPASAQAPDGGVLDGSTLLANTAGGNNMNVMDWSALLAGVAQPDGSIAPASKYQSITKNFYGSSGYEAIYGVSGGGPAFYYDGIKSTSAKGVPGNFCRILTGLAPNLETPRSVTAHQGGLFLGYYAGIVQWSNIDNVLNFDPTLGLGGASGAGLGDRVTGMAVVNGDTLAVWTQKTVQVLQGSIYLQTATRLTISPTSGGIEYTQQPMTNYMYADFRGITMVGTTQKYGDFEVGHVSSIVAPYLVPRLQLSAFFESGNIGVINSVLKRNKNQFCLFMADGDVMTLSLLVDGEEPQFTRQKYFKSDGTTAVTWDVIQAFTESTGRDRIFGATADGTGNVFELERSNTFNGGAIPAYAILVPDHILDQTGITGWSNKNFPDLHVYGRAQDYATFKVSRSGDYDALNTQALNLIPQIFGASTVAPTGNTAPFMSNSELKINGRALNIRIDSGSGTDPSATTPQFPHVIQAVEYDVKPLNPKRGA